MRRAKISGYWNHIGSHPQLLGTVVFGRGASKLDHVADMHLCVMRLRRPLVNTDLNVIFGDLI